MKRLLALVLLAACVAAGPATGSAQQPRDLNCLEQENELVSCFFVKAAGAIGRAARSSDIKLLDGITFVRDTPTERAGKSLEKSELEIMNELPRDNSDKAIKLLGMLYDSAVSFMKSHSLKVSMPEGTVARALVEGRGKIKKMILPLVAAAGLKIFALLPIMLGGLGLLALQALFFGKIALLVAGIVAFQKLFSGGNVVGSVFGKNPAPNVWYDNGAATGWAAANPTGLPHQGYRSFVDAKIDAHNLAYSAQAPFADNRAD